MASFSDILTPGQVQQVLDAHGIPWREYNPNDDGWIRLLIDDYVGLGFNSTCGINIFHGGFRDHYMNGTDEGGADLVKFTAMCRTGEADTTAITDADILDAIQWIKELLGINKGVKPPELDGTAEFANSWLKEKENKFVRVPNDIWQSKLSASAKLVWMAIFSRCNKDEIYSFAGVRDISKQTSLASATVQRAIKELETAGVLLQKPSRVGQKINKYAVVTTSDKINEKITVSETDTHRIRNEYGTVSEMSTELDPSNKNHELYPNSKGRKQVSDPFSFSLFYLTSKQNIGAYSEFEALPESVKANYNPEWSYDSESGNWLNANGTPAIWDVPPPTEGTAEYDEMLRHERQEAAI